MHALARVGFSRQANVDAVDEALRYAFLDQLDYGTVVREVGEAVGSFRWVRLLEAVGTEPPRASFLILSEAESSLASRDVTTAEPCGLVLFCAEDLPPEIERLMSRELASTWIARQRRDPDAVRVRAWYPCRLDMLESGGDMSDLRISVSAPLRERFLVLETLMEVLPTATIVSSLVAEGRRPERHPKPKPGDAEWPRESNRAPFRS